MATTRTTCPYCGVGCGVNATPQGADVIAVAGDDKHPANGGRLCVKGTALGETLDTGGRLLYPRLHNKRVSWDRALDTLTRRLSETRKTYGPGSIAFYLSGQLLTEDYYVANKLMKGFLGSANVDTNSRLCMSSAVSAHKRAFGEDIVPVSYVDAETCDLLVITGSNAAWSHPVLFQRVAAARRENPDMRVVVIDTRRTATCDIADIFLEVAPGSDGHLFGGLLNYLAEHEYTDAAYIKAHTEGFDEALAAVRYLDLASVAQATGLAPDALAQFYALFAKTARTVTLFSQGINQSATGTDKGNAIINCHLATGRIGKPGAGPFSITGQPNAMGGREVGGLATQLAAHRDFSPADTDAVARFWKATDMARSPGLPAVALFDAIEAGEIKFLWVMATNPAVSLPDTVQVRRALEKCEFVVVSDCSAKTDTGAFADLLLPAAGWGEKDGTVTNSERVISRQRALTPAPGQAKPDWWIVTEVARRLGYAEAFDYDSPAKIFAEHAALSGFENNGERAFDISALARLDAAQYDALEPVRWPCPETPHTGELFEDGRFYTPSHRARFVAVTPALPDSGDDLVVNTGRLRAQWHTMTRTGTVARLARHRDFFEVQINPADAARRGIAPGDLVQLDNHHGSVRGAARLDADLPIGQVFVPIHWNNRFTARGTVNELFPPVVDPVSGQPQAKYTRAKLSALATGSWGFLFSRTPVTLPRLSYWSRIAVAQGELILLADRRDVASLHRLLLPVLDKTRSPATGEFATYEDQATGDLRLAGLHTGQVSTALFLHSDRNCLPARDWLGKLGSLTDAGPGQVLAGFDADSKDQGALVCSCWEVGETAIVEAIAAGANSVEALGETLRCGTQCGSCIPELRQYLKSAQDKVIAVAC